MAAVASKLLRYMTKALDVPVSVWLVDGGGNAFIFIESWFKSVSCVSVCVCVCARVLSSLIMPRLSV
jgi:hypothetical protein